nr:RNA-directed DNA polymerase, eukaryota, reverse transcriptase zinc-binding domain protein [Tanacetum cinerariifolium]
CNSRGGVEQAQFKRLKEMVEGVTLSNSHDRWSWSLVGSGDFLVSSVRKLIDNAILPKVEALIQKLIDEDKGHQNAILNLALQFENVCTAKDDLRHAYEKCNDISQESRVLIDSFLKEGSDKDYELNLSMYEKTEKLEKRMDAKLAWLLEKYYYRSQESVGCSSSHAELYLTKKELQQLHLDEEDLRETLKEKHWVKKHKRRKLGKNKLMMMNSLWNLGVGNTRKHAGFWIAFLQYMQSKTKQYGRRTYDMENGASNEYYYAMALVDYEAETITTFKLRHCWEIVKDSPKWMQSEVPKFAGKSEEDEVSEIRRLIGRDKAKDAAKKKGSRASGSSSMNDEALARLMVSEIVTQNERVQRQEDVKFHLQSYDHLIGDAQVAMKALRAEIKAKYNLPN